MSEGRISPTTYDQAILFSEVFGDLISSFSKQGIPLTPECLINMDETLIQVTEKGGLDV